MSSGPPLRRPVRSGLVAAAVAVLVAAWLGILLVAVVPRERAATVGHWSSTLTALARERANALARRIAEAEGDAALVAHYPTTRYLLSGASTPPYPFPVEAGPRGHLQALLEELDRTQGYSGACVLPASLRAGAAEEVAVGAPCDEVCRSLAARALAEGRAVTEMAANGHGVSVLFASVTRGADGAPLGAVVLRHRAESWLIPLLGRNPLGTGGLVTTLAWRSAAGTVGQLQSPVVVAPTPSGTASTLILDVLGTGGAAFGDLRGARGQAMLAAAVGLGQPPWAVVSAIPRTEALAPFHRSVRDMVAVSGAVVVTLLALAFAAWRGLSARHRGELAQRERRFRAAVDHLAQSFVIYDDDRRPTYVNPAGLRMAGRSLDEIRGRSGDDVAGLALAAEYSPALDRALATGTRQTVEHAVEVDGRAVSLVTDYVPVTDRHGRVEQVLGISHDVTDLVRVRQQLEESRRQLATLFANLPGMAYSCRLDQSWTMLLVSEGCRALTGWEAEAFLDGSVSYASLVAAEDRPEVRRTIEIEVEAGRPFELIYRITARDGSVRWVWEKGRAVPGDDGGEVVLEGFITDITPLHAAEAQNALLATVVQQSSEIVVITDPKGVVEYVNPAFEAVTGWTAHDAVGNHTRMLKSGVHPDTFYADLWRTITSGATWRGRMTNRRRDGSLYEEHVSIFPVRDIDGTIVRFVALKRDVSQEVALEHQLQHAQRLEAVGRLAGGVAHDFNNLLQALIAQISVLHAEPGLPEPVQDRVREMQRVVQGGASLTRQLLLFSRREVSHPERLDLNAVVHQAEMLLRRLLPAPIALELDLSDGVLPVNADRGQLEQILVNLAVNAADAMLDGGTLTIVTGRDGDGSVGLDVRDTGPGIPADIRERIFEPFFTTKDAGSGTGLGLSVVHGIVTRHGGSIRVDCPAAGGAVFHIAFPWSGSGEFQVARDAEIAADVSPAAGERVLVVEDEAAAREGLVAGLALLGFRPTGVGTAAEAEALPADEPFDLVLADLVLPDRNGAELATRLSRRWPDMAVVLMSGYTEDMAVRLGVRDGNVRFLQKPFSFDDLSRELRRALEDTPSRASGSAE